ncbi:MAG: hypothetical protein ACOYBY_01700 [Dermatophilaceae bacterium]
MPRPPESTRPSIDLSLTQVVAASAGAGVAAATAGIMRLAGTVLGTLVVTVVATVATALVSLWLRRSRHRLTRRAGAHRSAMAAERTLGEQAQRSAPDPPRSPRSRSVLAGLVGGIVAATLLAASGHPVLSLRVDASAVDELQRVMRDAGGHVQSWAAGLA